MIVYIPEDYNSDNFIMLDTSKSYEIVSDLRYPGHKICQVEINYKYCDTLTSAPFWHTALSLEDINKLLFNSKFEEKFLKEIDL